MGCVSSNDDKSTSKINVIYNVLESHLGEIAVLSDPNKN